MQPSWRRPDAAEAARLQALAALRARDAATGLLLAPEAADLASIRAGLGKEEALLAIAPAFDGAYSLVVTADQALIHRLALPRAELVALAAQVRDGAAALDFDASAAARLAAVLLPPETRAALAGIKTLRVLAAGQLASLPFGLLVLDEGKQGRAPVWLADRFALANTAALGRPSRASRKRGRIAQLQPPPAGMPQHGAGVDFHHRPLPGGSNGHTAKGPRSRCSSRMPEKLARATCAAPTQSNRLEALPPPAALNASSQARQWRKSRLSPSAAPIQKWRRATPSMKPCAPKSGSSRQCESTKAQNCGPVAGASRPGR